MRVSNCGNTPMVRTLLAHPGVVVNAHSTVGGSRPLFIFVSDNSKAKAWIFFQRGPVEAIKKLGFSRQSTFRDMET
jgi:hypothetical protein